MVTPVRAAVLRGVDEPFTFEDLTLDDIRPDEVLVKITAVGLCHTDLAVQPGAIPAVGGAMDLATGAKATWVMMEHNTKSGEAKIVERCSYPLTGLACVRRIYTDLAVLDITPEGVRVREIAEGLDFDTLQARTGTALLR